MSTLYAYSLGHHNETGASLHYAVSVKDEKPRELHHGFGIVFPHCVFDDTSLDGSSRGLIAPWICRTPDGYAAFGLRLPVPAGAEARPAPDGLCRFVSEDLISWHELPVVKSAMFDLANDVRLCAQEEGFRLFVHTDDWKAYDTTDFASFAPVQADDIPERISLDLWDAEGACAISIDEDTAARLLLRFTPPTYPKDTPKYPFPFMPCRGDPMAIPYKDGYLFMATDDEHGQKALKIRYAKDIGAIAESDDHVLLDATPGGDYSGCLWAPELHRVNGRLCIFFAAGMPHWYTVQSRIMLLEGDDPCDRASWSQPRRIVRQDGSPLYTDGITLDMTVLDTRSGLYVVWSQRQILLDPVRCNTADLMIARLDPEKPWQLASEPQLLCRPEYGWEREHSPVCEGPFLLKQDGTLFLTYAAALIDSTYCVGLLTARDGDDLLLPESWHKNSTPVFHRLSMPDMIGSGHNAFVQDREGRDWMLIHALHMENYRRDAADLRRYPRILPVAWDETGFPHFDAEVN